MNRDALSWALAKPAGSRWLALAEAYTSGMSRVTFEGRTVEYRTMREIATAIEAGYGAQSVAHRRPAMTVAVVGDGQR